ncbi:YfdX family protein [Granulosicoccus antarcticus]|uniref:YfdX protein n=1 Tax=Granulosicoccus antarcticus IMCC3135 TaxID=1192854 RepID=A0A2Z2P745_9GAMM|nr:YfdX family protein [Granulosicoccus antarcticus]ASJ75674.1 hypothetical protein IMCC3135_28110 [Granulosicoccus antarcticus IMCC3135]
MNPRKQLLTLAIAGILGSSTLILGSSAFAQSTTPATDKPVAEVVTPAPSDVAQSTKAATETTATEAEKIASSNEAKPSLIKTVDEAYKALQEIRGARMAIFNGSPEQAVKLTGEARTDLAAANDSMQENALATQKKVDDNETYIPFDTSMSLAEGFVPDEAKQAALTKANEHLAKGEKQHAVEALKLGNIDVAVSAAMIPASNSLKHVDEAVKLLNEKKYYEANLALKAVEDSVLIETYDINSIPVQGVAKQG